MKGGRLQFDTRLLFNLTIMPSGCPPSKRASSSGWSRVRINIPPLVVFALIDAIFSYHLKHHYRRKPTHVPDCSHRHIVITTITTIATIVTIIGVISLCIWGTSPTHIASLPQQLVSFPQQFCFISPTICFTSPTIWFISPTIWVISPNHFLISPTILCQFAP